MSEYIDRQSFIKSIWHNRIHTNKAATACTKS